MLMQGSLWGEAWKRSEILYVTLLCYMWCRQCVKPKPAEKLLMLTNVYVCAEQDINLVQHFKYHTH